MFATILSTGLRLGVRFAVPVILDTAIRWLESERSRRPL